MTQQQPQSDPVDEIRRRLSWKIIPVVVLTVGVFWVLVGQLEDVREFREALESARWTGLAAAVGLAAVHQVVAAWRFQVVLKAVGHRIGLWRSFEVLLAVWPVALVVPSRGNDFVRALALREEVPMLACTGSVVAERLVDIQTLALLGMVGCGLMGAWEWFGVLAAIWVGVWIGIAVVATSFESVIQWPFVQRFESKLRSLFDAFEALRERPAYLAGLIGISGLSWVTGMATIGVLLWMFGVELPVEAIVAFWPLAVFVGILPLTVGGMGTRDAAFAGVLTATGTAAFESGILAATVGYGVVAFLLPAAAGIPFMLRVFWRDEDRRSGPDR